MSNLMSNYMPSATLFANAKLFDGSLGSGYSVMWQVVNTGDEASCANCIISKDTSRLNTRDALCAGFLIEAREMHGHVS
jgi:hypothetical protein